MAENILGILLVTSTSRGRNVFRYPPDPTSPHSRLTQPIYPSATYTATDISVQRPAVRRLVSSELRRADGQTKSSQVSLKSSRRLRFGDGSSEGGSSRKGSGVGLGLRSVSERPDEDGDGGPIPDEEDESDDSSDSDSDVPRQPAPVHPGRGRNGGGGGSRRTSQETAGAVSRRSSQETARLVPASVAMTKVDSHASADKHNLTSLSPAVALSQPEPEPEAEAEPDKFVEAQYNHALNYTLDFLSDMLTPPRSACNRKFEITVDELVFVGHPVRTNEQGKWAYPAEEEEDRQPTRGRRGLAMDIRSPLGTVQEDRETSSPEKSRESLNRAPTGAPEGKESTDEPPTLNMFQLVLILDKPDPKPGDSVSDGIVPLSMFDEVYHEIAFKWTAAAFALQVQDNYIARETWEMAKLREKCISEGIPILECLRLVYEKSSLDRAMNRLLIAIRDLQRKPLNPLYSFLPTTITVHLADLPISMVLSPRVTESDEAWAQWGDIDDYSDSDDEEDSEIGLEDRLSGRVMSGTKHPDLRVEPWQTLLLLQGDADTVAREVTDAVMGMAGDLDEPDIVAGAVIGPRRASGGPTAEEGEALMLKQLIEACDVNKRLADIAHVLRFDLEAIVIPLARELVQNKKAILIDVVNTRLRTAVMPTTIMEHSSSLSDYSAAFAQLFPDMPPLPAFLSSISASPVQYREQLPDGPSTRLDVRQKYLDALLWLLRQDLLVQVHVRVRIFARPAIKRKAWISLWHRRRNRWIAAQERAKKEPDSPHSDLVTPKAGPPIRNPLELSVTSTWSSGYIDQSILDYDPDLEMDSDQGEGDDDRRAAEQRFEAGVVEPKPEDIPRFEGSFIFRPARAHKDEARWLRAIRETADEVTASKFDLCVQYFDGVATFEEIAYRTGLPRREIDRLLESFRDDVMTFLHP